MKTFRLQTCPAPLPLTATFVALSGAICPHRAAAQTQAQTTAHALHDGALRGQVVDIESGKPVAGAIVALRDRRAATIAWTSTDAEGHYTLAVPALQTLQLQGRRPGMAMRVLGAGAKIVAAPVKFVDGAVMHGGVSEVVRMGIAAAFGGPLAMGGVALGRLQGAAIGKVSDAVETSMAESNGTIDVAGGPMRSVNARTRADGAPGGVMLSVSAPAYRDLKMGWAGAYWIAPPTADGSVGAQAFLEPVELARPSSLRESRVHPTAIALSDLTVGSLLVPAGQSVPVTVKLNQPDDTPLPIRIFARSSVGGAVAELTPLAGSPGFYGGSLPIPAGADSEAGIVSVVALHAEPVDVKLPTPKSPHTDALTVAAARLNGLRAEKPFEYDPCVFAAENRLNAPISVLGRRELSPTMGTESVASLVGKKASAMAVER